MIAVPQSHQDLLRDDAKAFVYLGTLMNDGSPQVTPIWFSYKDGYIYINSAVGRAKDRNMRQDPRVGLTIADPKNPYRYIQVRGKVIEITEEGGDAHIHQLSQKYMGKPYTLVPGQVRVIYRIEPERVTVSG